MTDITSKYSAAIAAHMTHAAAIAQSRGLRVRVEGPFLRLRRRHSHAFLLLHPTHIMLELIEVEPCDRCKQHGSALLDDVIAIGDALGLRIDLIAEGPAVPEQRALAQSALESWYCRHEFVGAGDTLMRHTPRDIHRTFTRTSYHS